MSAQKPLCEIKCLHCDQWLGSPIQFGDADSFFTSTLVGNQVQCPKCGKMTGCNKANMRFRTGDEGFLGKDT